LLCYQREWAPGSHTLLLAGRFDDTLLLNDINQPHLYLRTTVSPFPPFPSFSAVGTTNLAVNYRRELEAYFTELQQIWQNDSHTLIAGARYQTASADTSSRLTLPPLVTVIITPGGAQTNIQPRGLTNKPGTDLNRLSFYAYDHWQILESLRLIAGVTYDRLHYPRNIDTSPITSAETTTDLVSPKGGILWSP